MTAEGLASAAAASLQLSEDSAEESYRKLCAHYTRGCSFVSPCCGKVYPCRLCHNENEAAHEIDRYAVSKIICRKCNTRQPVVELCKNCGIRFGRYSCLICRLYDDTDKGQFHCEKCGLCRVGGRDNFFHCDNCGLCLPNSMMDDHTCRKAASKSNCPVCMEDIHTSRTAPILPKCGHFIHSSCYAKMGENGLYRCPQCCVSLFDMTAAWMRMDAEVQAWPLPQHFKDFIVKIKCQDCQTESDTNFHFVGLKCSSCGSYNTVRCGNEELPEDNQQQNDDNDDLSSSSSSSGEEGESQVSGHNHSDEVSGSDRGAGDGVSLSGSESGSESSASAESDEGSIGSASSGMDGHLVNQYLHDFAPMIQDWWWDYPHFVDWPSSGDEANSLEESDNSWETEEEEVVIGGELDEDDTSGDSSKATGGGACCRS